ncbi:MAG TPA: methyltransferase domain-containing protein [Anaerolineales bacterium]|nr:methyltransferase domain-containing protein [Anaerolineales bacterium]
MPEEKRPPVCDYEGSDYQARFWEKGERDYEDRCEAIALKRLLPARGKSMLELGAGAGRNTSRYQDFERIVLLDYSRTQLQQARARLGSSEKYLYVAANIYCLPFVDGLFDAATMIRTLHHMADAPAALRQVWNVLQPGSHLILEYANKRNVKSILRYALRRQEWSPFDREPIEFAPLNFDFHPAAIRSWLEGTGFRIEKILTVSHFRVGFIKRAIPATILAGLDSLLQWSGALVQLSPSVFLRAGIDHKHVTAPAGAFFKCPECGSSPLETKRDHLFCTGCKRKWAIHDGIYDFREAVP